MSEFLEKPLVEIQDIEKYVIDKFHNTSVHQLIDFYYALTISEREVNDVMDNYPMSRQISITKAIAILYNVKYQHQDCKECTRLQKQLDSITCVAGCYRNAIDRVRYLYTIRDIVYHFNI